MFDLVISLMTKELLRKKVDVKPKPFHCCLQASYCWKCYK